MFVVFVKVHANFFNYVQPLKTYFLSSCGGLVGKGVRFSFSKFITLYVPVLLMYVLPLSMCSIRVKAHAKVCVKVQNVVISGWF